jgi:hypothetical protein
VRNWYVVNTHPHQEARAEVNLRQQGYEAWLPAVAQRRHAPCRHHIGAAVPRLLFAADLNARPARVSDAPGCASSSASIRAIERGLWKRKETATTAGSSRCLQRDLNQGSPCVADRTVRQFYRDVVAARGQDPWRCCSIFWA